MKIFIKSLGNISPQKTFGQPSLPVDLVEHTGNRMSCVEPAYGDLIDAKLIRRMSRIIRMGVAAAIQCLREGSLESPDAIITGTAYGCLEDTGVFLTKLINNREELLTPTAFIQSTHNTVGAQIALMLKCHRYNNTFVHRGFSFESALLDGCMLLEEHYGNNILVGAVDEITDVSHSILSRFGLYTNNQDASNLSLFSNDSKGTINGEGASFFLLTSDEEGKNLAWLEGMETFFQASDQLSIPEKIRSFLEQHEVELQDVDLIITGRNGDPKNDKVYEALDRSLFKAMPVCPYKHLCGEYPTAAAFAMWLATSLIHQQTLPTWLGLNNEVDPGRLRRILIYNHFQNMHHSLYLISRC
jgi:3-oxoacyl-(acyl-carrier-protein) synthase